MQIHEHDCVRLLAGFTGPNVYASGESTVPAGAEGCAISVFADACMVEFDGNVIMNVPTSQLIKTWDAATRQDVA